MRKILKISLVVLLLIELTGCMKMNVNIKLNEDGSYNTFGTLLFDEELMNELDIKDDDILLEFKKAGYDFKKGNHTNIEDNIDGIKYKGISFSYENGELLKPSITIENHETTLSIKSFDNIKFENFDPNVFDDKLNDKEILKALGTEAKLTIQMPGKIKETNIGKITSYNTVEINLLEEDGSINIVSYSDTFDFLIYVAAGILILIVLLIAIIVRRNKRNIKNYKLDFVRSNDNNMLVDQNTVDETNINPQQENKDNQ